MSLKILYVEDRLADRERIEAAIESRAQAIGKRPILLQTVTSPEELQGALDEHYDVILSDVMFPDSKGKRWDRLSDIIKTAKDWSEKNKLGQPIPIIAYTVGGDKILAACLARRDDLYDIWDKSTASAEYVTWKFEQLTLELSRTRPDALLQRLIRTMQKGARWHSHVVSMTQNYARGWTEMDQITRTGDCIRHIGSS